MLTVTLSIIPWFICYFWVGVFLDLIFILKTLVLTGVMLTIMQAQSKKCRYFYMCHFFVSANPSAKIPYTQWRNSNIDLAFMLKIGQHLFVGQSAHIFLLLFLVYFLLMKRVTLSRKGFFGSEISVLFPLKFFLSSWGSAT